VNTLNIRVSLLIFVISITPSILFAKDWSKPNNSDAGETVVGQVTNYSDHYFEFRSAEIELGDAETKHIRSTLKSMDDIIKYGFNTVTVTLICGFTEEGVKRRFDNANKQDRILDGLIGSCYNPTFRTRYKDGSKWRAKNVTALEMYANHAHKLGLRFNLKPMVLTHIETYGLNGMSKQSFWQGDKNFVAYSDFIVDLASIAEANKIEYFTIGTELTNLNKKILRSPELTDLIEGVREVYSGKLIYAHNFGPEGSGNEFRKMSKIWERLDYIGVNFFPNNIMKGRKSYSSEQVAKAMESARIDGRNVISEIRNVSAKVNRPVILTETAFPSWKGAANYMYRGTCDRANAGKKDWVFTKGPLQPKTPDLDEPLVLAKAWWQVFGNMPNIAGAVHVFWTGPGERVLEYYLKNKNAPERERKLKKILDDRECDAYMWKKETGVKEFFQQKYINRSD